MKKRRQIVAVCAMTVMALSPCDASALSLVYSDHEPLGNMRTTFLNDVFFRSIEEQSGGNITITPHWNSEISTGYDALKTVQEGSQAQLAVVVPEYCAKDLPLHQLFKSFPTGPTGQEQVEFFRGVYREVPELLREVEAQGLQIIFIATGYPAAFFSSKPLAGLKAINGQRWRSASFWHKDFLSNAGAVPVTMPWGPGVSDALNEGTLDGLIVNIDSGYDIKAHKPAPNILTSQKLWLGHEYIIAVNKDVWDNLTDEDKQAVENAADLAYNKLGEVMTTSFLKQLETLREDNAVIRLLSDDEVNFWEHESQYEAVQDKWVNENISAKEVLNKIRRYMARFTGAENE